MPSTQTAGTYLLRRHCYDGFVSCRDGTYCIIQEWECDAVVDCPDGSDEDHCHQSVSTGMFSGFAPRMGLYVPFYSLESITVCIVLSKTQ